ncbi:MAG TPA: c-type cytochrome domain-containing protein [Tepidisphaeraceae bacterium]
MVRTRRMTGTLRGVVLAAVAGLGLAAFAGSATAADQPTVSYSKDIQPIFKASCIKCHSLDNPRHKAAAGFRLDNRDMALKGGDNAHEKDIIPGNAKESVLVQLLHGSVTVEGEDIESMPKKKKGESFKPLPEKQVELIKAWIDQGAKWSG